MKTFLASLLLLTSISTFAQQIDSVDLIFFRGLSLEKEWETNAVKVKITRAFYERMVTEELVLDCRVTTNKKARLFLLKGQVGIKHPQDPEPALCKPAGCFTTQLEDLAAKHTGATLYTDDEITNNRVTFIVSSAVYYESEREFWDYKKVKWPNVSDMPYVTIFDPKIHSLKEIPVTNSFFCRVMNMNNEMVSP